MEVIIIRICYIWLREVIWKEAILKSISKYSNVTEKEEWPLLVTEMCLIVSMAEIYCVY
jgi:hypothetical protein